MLLIDFAGKPFSAPEAHKLGLVDHLVKTPTELIPAAIKLALAIASGQAPRIQACKSNKKLKTQEEDLLTLSASRIQTKVQHPDNPK